MHALGVRVGRQFLIYLVNQEHSICQLQQPKYSMLSKGYIFPSGLQFRWPNFFIFSLEGSKETHNFNRLQMSQELALILSSDIGTFSGTQKKSLQTMTFFSVFKVHTLLTGEVKCFLKKCTAWAKFRDEIKSLHAFTVFQAFLKNVCDWGFSMS